MNTLDKDKQKIIENSPMVKILTECIEEAFVEMIDDTVHEIMSLKSVTYGEALPIAMSLIGQGIKPKSEEFYERVDTIKTAWEY